MKKLIKLLAADKDRSIFFTGVTILSAVAAVIAVSHEQYMLTAMSGGGAVVGLVGLLSRAVIELATPVVNKAILSMTGQFRKIEDNKRVKLISADKDRSIFFTGVTITSAAVAVIAVSHEQYVLTAMSGGGAVVGLVGLLSRAVIELAAPVVNQAILSMTGQFRKFEN